MKMLPARWETKRLTIRDSSLAEVSRLRQVFNACAYVEKWDSTFHQETEAGFIKLVTKSLSHDAGDHNFRLQAVRLTDDETDDETIIGYFHLYHGFPQPPLVLISMFVIHPDYQQQRYGAELIAGLAARLRQLGDYRAIRLKVYLKNWPALRFWINAGFTTIIEYRGDKIHSEKAYASLILEKPLNTLP